MARRVERLTAGLLLVCLASAPSPAAAARAPSLCASPAATVFACNVGSKTASLCADPNGVISYRFGRPDHADLSLTSAGRSGGRMTYGALSYSGGGGDYVRVWHDRQSYVVYSAIGRGWEQEGLVVEKDGRRLSAMRCDGKGSALGARGWASVYAAHLPNDTQGFDKPD